MRRSSSNAATALANATVNWTGSVLEIGRLKMTTSIDMDNNKILNLGDGSGAQDAAAFNQAGGAGDARTIYTRTFQLTQAQIAAKGAVTTANWSMFTLAANEGVRWIWFRTLSSFTGGPNVYINVGWTGTTGGLYAQTAMTSAGNYDDNAQHANDSLGSYDEMGDAGAQYDATALMGAGHAIKVYSQTTSGNHDAVTGGGPLYINVEIVRYDASQLENVS